MGDGGRRKEERREGGERGGVEERLCLRHHCSHLGILLVSQPPGWLGGCSHGPHLSSYRHPDSHLITKDYSRSPGRMELSKGPVRRLQTRNLKRLSPFLKEGQAY